MRLDRLIQTLLPHDEKFFALFDEMTRLLVQASEVLLKMPSGSLRDRVPLADQIHDLENQADNVTHKIHRELDASFVTPFDREDIHELASKLDDVLDCIYGSARRIIIYRVKEFTPYFVEFADIIRLNSLEIQRGVSLLNDFRRASEIREVILKINSYENQADRIFERALENLFEKEKDPINLVKVKEILVTLETAADKCEDVANILESLIIKHA